MTPNLPISPIAAPRKARGRIVGLVLHAAAQAGVAPYSLVSWQADANIGIGLGILGFWCWDSHGRLATS